MTADNVVVCNRPDVTYYGSCSQTLLGKGTHPKSNGTRGIQTWNAYISSSVEYSQYKGILGLQPLKLQLFYTMCKNY